MGDEERFITPRLWNEGEYWVFGPKLEFVKSIPKFVYNPVNDTGYVEFISGPEAWSLYGA